MESVLSREQAQTRFLAVVLPALTLLTHLLLCLSFSAPNSEQPARYWSLGFNVLAAGTSVLGVVGAAKLAPRLVSVYTTFHTITLSFITLALVNMISPFDFRLLNPMLPSVQTNTTTLCHDMHAGFGLEEDWLIECSRAFHIVKLCVAWCGLVLMVAQWWALVTVRRWGQELSLGQMMDGVTDIETIGLTQEERVLWVDEKMEC